MLGICKRDFLHGFSTASLGWLVHLGCYLLVNMSRFTNINAQLCYLKDIIMDYLWKVPKSTQKCKKNKYIQKMINALTFILLVSHYFSNNVISNRFCFFAPKRVKTAVCNFYYNMFFTCVTMS